MKYLRKYNESSTDTQFDELMDNFLYINDTLGEPEVLKSKWTNSSFKYRLVWKLGINIYDLQKPSDIVEKLKLIVGNFEDIISAEERVSDFTIKMSIDLHSRLVVEATPIELGSDNYQFIVGQMWREIRFNINEIERFLNKNDINIKTKEVIDEVETSDTTWIDIKTDQIPADVRQDLINRFNTELSEKLVDKIDYSNRDGFKPQIDREVEIQVGQNFIKIYPFGEKTYLTF